MKVSVPPSGTKNNKSLFWLLCLTTFKTAKAVLDITIFQDGPDVRMSSSGTLDLTGAVLTSPGQGCGGGGGIFNNDVWIGCTGGGVTVDIYALTGPPNMASVVGPGYVDPGFSDVDDTVATAAGRSFVMRGGTFGDFGVPAGSTGVVDFTNFGNTWLGTTLAAFGMTTNGVLGTWTLTGSGDTINFIVGAAGGASGDPHFVRWAQEHHDSFHGECDLNLISSKNVDVHLRTSIRRDSYSFIDKLAMRVGDHIIEADAKHMFLDGKELDFRDKKLFPYEIGFLESPFEHSKMNMITMKKLGKKKFRIQWGTGAHIEFRAVGIYMNVEVDGGAEDFGDSVGMMGRFGTGEMLDRHGNPMDDMDAFGFEWQVKEDDPILFLDQRAPQWPDQRCRMPTSPERRNLREDPKLAKEAEDACAGVVDFDMCVHDIMLTGELELAELF